MSTLVQNRNEGAQKSAENRYPLVDVFRLICACLIVVIHCLENIEGHSFTYMITVCFSKQAVPYFFIVSGFFFAKKLYSSENKAAVIKEYIKKQLLLYIAWVALEFPFVIQDYLNKYPNETLVYMMLVISRRILLAGEGVYWWLLALAEASLLAGVLISCKKEKILYIIAVLGLLLGYCYDAAISCLFLGKVNEIFYFLFSWSNNFLMKGLPYIAVGVFTAKHLEQIKGKIKNTLLVAIYATVSIVSVIVYVIISSKDVELTRYMLFYPIQAILLFIIALNSNCKGISKEKSIALRDISATIYFLHATIIYRVVDVIWSVNAAILLKFSISIILSLLVYYIARKTRFKPLCWLCTINIG